MEINSNFDESAGELTIEVKGRFDFSCLQAFRNSYTKISERPSKYTINLGGAEYLDSSALGMLLALRDHAGGDEANITIINCSEDIIKIFKITKLTELFNIS